VGRPLKRPGINWMHYMGISGTDVPVPDSTRFLRL